MIQNFQELWVHFWVIVGFFIFFLFFWYLSMFGASSGLIFLFFWCISIFWEIRINKFVQIPKKIKKQTTRCTKPAQAPKKTKNIKFPGTMGPLLSSCWNFWFFWCLSMFGASSGLFFLFFLVPVNIFVYHTSRSWWRKYVLLGF